VLLKSVSFQFTHSVHRFWPVFGADWLFCSQFRPLNVKLTSKMKLVGMYSSQKSAKSSYGHPYNLHNQQKNANMCISLDVISRCTPELCCMWYYTVSGSMFLVLSGALGSFFHRPKNLSCHMGLCMRPVVSISFQNVPPPCSHIK